MEREVSVSPPYGRVGFGPGYITGTMKVDGEPAARRIHLTERASQRLVATTFSNTDGTYRFDWLDTEIEFDLRAQDWTRERRDNVLSAVKPKPYPP